MKRFLPRTVRDRVRPWVQRVGRGTQAVQRNLRDSAIWPKPASWYPLREKLASMQDLHELYRFAATEFGILQIEAEIVPFLAYVQEHQPRCLGEIGLKHGGNSFLFLRACTAAQHFIGLDLKLQNIGKLRFLASPKQRIDVIEGNSYAPATVARTQRLLRGGQFDFLFIDGDHEYEGVRRDFEAYRGMVRSGGLIAFHDIVPDEMARSGRRSSGSQCYGGGVYRLWQELRSQFPHREFVASWDQYGFGIGVLQLP